jgi:hypothetical protein
MSDTDETTEMVMTALASQPRAVDRLCSRCKHPDHWHRHDDANNYPPETAPFRCLGYDCDKPGFACGTPQTRCGCPDFVE